MKSFVVTRTTLYERHLQTNRMSLRRPYNRRHGMAIRSWGMITVVCLAGALSCAGGSTPSEGAAQPVALAFVAQPGAATAGSPISPAVQVAIRDAAGNTVTGASANVSIAIAAGRGASGAVLTGTLTRTAVNGIATFADLAIDLAGTNYALSANAASLTSATSAAFDVSAPTSGTLLLQENFEDGNLAARGWYDNTNVLLSTVEKVPGSNSSAQYRFLVGAAGPTSGGAQRHKFTPSTSLYVSYYVKYSANWIGSGKTYHPHEFYAMSNLDGDFDGPASNWMTIYVEHNYQNGGRPRMSMQDNKAINTTSGSPP